MATFTNNFYGGGKGYNLCLDVTTNSQNTANNTSNVTVKVRLVSLGSSYTISSSTSKDGSVTIDGTKYTFTFTAGLTGNQNKTLFTKTLDIAHGSDGTKTLSVSATCYLGVTLSGTFHGNTTVSGSTALTAIPRSTAVSVSGGGTFGTTKTIYHSRASSSFTITLRYTCGSSSGTIVTKTSADSTNWTPPKSLQSEIPKSTSTTITIYCDTYNGSTLIGTSSTSFTCNIASDCVPTISSGSFTCVETGGTTYYQTAHRMRAEITCSGAYGSTISKYVMTVDGQSITNYGNIIWTGYLTGSGYKDVVLTITDSRGKTATKTWSSAIYITAYSKPKVYSFTCKRMGYDDDGSFVISNLGTHGYISYSVTFHSNATNKTIKMQYKPTSSTSWTNVSLSAQSMTDYNFSSSLSTSSAYDLKLILTDNISTVEQSIVMQNIFPLINLSADGSAIAFGKECNATNKFMVEMNASFNKNTAFWTSEFSSTATFNGTSTFNSQALFKYGGNGVTTQINGGTIYLNSYNALTYDSTNTQFKINGDLNVPCVTIRGCTYMQDRGSYPCILYVKTSGDGNAQGNGDTCFGYYDSGLGGYTHYLRGQGRVSIDTRYGLLVNRGNMALAGTGWLMADQMAYYTSGGYVNSSGNQTWGVGCANHFVPTTTTRYLGVSTSRWEGLYCVNSPNVSSDARMKRDVKYMYNQPEELSEFTDVKDNDEITTQDLLDFIKNDLYMTTFNYKQDTENMEDDEKAQITSMNNRQIGFIAQDMANTKVGKYLVTKDSDGTLGYESANWTSIIAGALQQEIRTREAEDKKLMDMLKDIINE